MKLPGIIALALALNCAPALAQTNPGTSPLSGGKGGTNNAFMQFAGPASSMKTFTLPNASGTIGVLNAIATWTGAQSFSDAKLILLGSSSGSSTLKAPATGGGTATLFAGTDTIVGRASTDTLTNKTFNCANNTCTVRLGSDVTGTLPKANGGLGATTLSSAIDTEFSSTRGSILYRGAAGWAALGPGSSGKLLATGGAGADPSWITASGTGTVTSVTCGQGMSGGAITTTGTCDVALSRVSNSLLANVAMNNTANYFPGPSVAQGTSGMWFASGTVTVSDSVSTAAFYCKLWDGTTVIASGSSYINAGTQRIAISLSGVIISPAGNIRIDCRDVTTTNGLIESNVTGNGSKDSTLTAIRIQ